jgi:hypothetical protein
MAAETISIEPMPVPAPCTAVLWRTGKFPAPEADRILLRAFLHRLSDVISARLHFTPQVFLQLEFLANGRDIYDRNAAAWRPKAGLGVWPNRPPPELWKSTDIFKMAAEYKRTGRMRPLMYRVLQIQGDPVPRAQAQLLMLGTGTVLSIWIPGGAEDFLLRTKNEFLKTIQSPNFRIFPFYVPLLDIQLLRDRKPGELDRWLCGDVVYLRESPTDNAIILVATMPLAPLLEEAGAKIRPGGEGWVLEEEIPEASRQ